MTTIKNKKVLFVCLGNICRSPAAEEVLRVKAAEKGIPVEIDSAGMIDYHEGELPDDRMRKYAAQRGYYLTHHSRPFSIEDFERYDLIIPMDENNYSSLQRLCTHPAHQSKIIKAASIINRPEVDCIPDPYYSDKNGFNHCLDLIEECCDKLIAQ